MKQGIAGSPGYEYIYRVKIKSIHIISVFLWIGSFGLASIPGFSQTPKGVITTNEKTTAPGKTRALVIGISRYQFIDTLSYAAADAAVFAAYLQSSSFWNIEKGDITVLLNDQAKYGDLTVQLQQVALQCQPGDNLIFYFSGHGDVETNTIFNRGFLLAQDTYSSNYMANGLRVDDLKDLFVTLQTNNVRVIVITDACRSGKLSGGIKGAEFTAAAIKNIWKNEIKILSSQPGQLSYEDQKWGNGRGVFSYYLIRGLNGEADANKDSSVTLAELEMYVGSNVARETTDKQQPIFEGPNKFSSVISRWGEKNAPGSKKAGNAITLNRAKLLQAADSCFHYFEQMEKAIQENKLLRTDPASAAGYYERIKTCSEDKSLVAKANARLLSVLMNKSQETVNQSFIGKTLVTYESFQQTNRFIDEILSLNDLKLPNMGHWKNLQRYLYVMGEATWNDQRDLPLLEKIIDTASKEEPDAAYLLTARALVEMRKEKWDAAAALLESALKKSPGWLIPQYNLGICYANKRNYRKALEYYEQVLEQDSSYKTFECAKCILLNMAQYALSTNQYKKCLKYLYRNTELFPDYWTPYEVLYEYAVTLKDSSVAREFIERSLRYDSSVSMQLIHLRFRNEFSGKPLSYTDIAGWSNRLRDNSDSADYYYTLSLYFRQKESYDEDSIFDCLYKAIALDSTDYFYRNELASSLIDVEKYEEAERILLEKSPDPDELDEWRETLLEVYLNTSKYHEALAVCRELLKSGYYSCDQVRKLKKAFKGMKEYEQLVKECRDQTN